MDYFNRRRASTVNHVDHQNGQPQQTGARYLPGAPSFESLRAPSNIRIRRLPSSTAIAQSRSNTGEQPGRAEEDWTANRRRSSSAPQRPNVDALMGSDLSKQRTLDGASHMPAITEGEQTTPGTMHPGFADGSGNTGPTTPGVNAQDMARQSPERADNGAHAMHSAQRRGFGLGRLRSSTGSTFRNDTRPSSRAQDYEYDSDVIDLLDLVDPEVRTIGTLTNLQNSLFVPDLGGLVNRRPTYNLTRDPTRTWNQGDLQRIARSRAGTRTTRPDTAATKPRSGEPSPPLDEDEIEMQPPRRTISISSELSDSHYAVLPHGVSLEGWSDEDVLELNDHVRHLLHSKREGFKRSMRGFKQYVSKPLGLFVTVYAVLVTLFGAAWVFALIGWIYVGSKQEYIINVIDLVLVALFALMGDGLAPFRAVDTYHMCFIAHYHHLTWRLRKEKQLPQLVDQNDLPDRRRSATDAELDDAIDKEEMAEFSVLTLRQQKRLQYHQAKFNKSHTFYKPHETATHHAFPIRLLVAVVVLLDCHSLLQVALGTCTWSIDYRVRPEALTATILSCSITCNIMAGVLISIGDHKTRKKDILERIFRQGLTEQALKRMAKTQERGKLSLAVDRTQVESADLLEAAQNAGLASNGEKSRPQTAAKSEARSSPSDS
ncbi:related to ahmp1 [Lecanosticta acicola]|uniref:Related to ahmp1 n=1 Tax=Lecanosticta acicola TaxID=111012 RepID=A0AAI8YRZ4_9PEZI|nr:related to ahmp1 [Lecanosticta acicola]